MKAVFVGVSDVFMGVDVGVGVVCLWVWVWE